MRRRWTVRDRRITTKLTHIFYYFLSFLFYILILTMGSVRTKNYTERIRFVARYCALLWPHLSSLLWRHNGGECVSNHQPPDRLLNRLFARWSIIHQSSASLAFVRGIHRRPVNSPHKWPVTRKMSPFDDVIMFQTFLFTVAARELIQFVSKISVASWRYMASKFWSTFVQAIVPNGWGHFY